MIMNMKQKKIKIELIAKVVRVLGPWFKFMEIYLVLYSRGKFMLVNSLRKSFHVEKKSSNTWSVEKVR